VRLNYPGLAYGATDEDVARYTRAYLLDLFGSMIFPYSSGDSVLVMYLRFLLDFDHPPVYNWGAGVLAFLYRSLSMACMSRKNTIGGPLLLLQH
jgi:Plant mobile domain